MGVLLVQRVLVLVLLLWLVLHDYAEGPPVPAAGLAEVPARRAPQSHESLRTGLAGASQRSLRTLLCQACEQGTYDQPVAWAQSSMGGTSLVSRQGRGDLGVAGGQDRLRGRQRWDQMEPSRKPAITQSISQGLSSFQSCPPTQGRAGRMQAAVKGAERSPGKARPAYLCYASCLRAQQLARAQLCTGSGGQS